MTSSIWSTCTKCSVLVYLGKQRCAAGGVHEQTQSGNYDLNGRRDSNDKQFKGQEGWKWCNKCNVLSFSASETGPGLCVAGSASEKLHDFGGSGDYVVMVNDPRGQQGWKWCKKCQGLCFTGESSSERPGYCKSKVDGPYHDTSSDGKYSLSVDGNPGGTQSQWHWCAKCQMLAYVGAARCAAGGVHSIDEKDLRSIDEKVSNLLGWKCCQKCSGLVNVGGVRAGTCPGSGTHDVSKSATYTLSSVNSLPDLGQPLWKQCDHCQELWEIRLGTTSAAFDFIGGRCLGNEHGKTHRSELASHSYELKRPTI